MDKDWEDNGRLEKEEGKEGDVSGFRERRIRGDEEGDWDGRQWITREWKGGRKGPEEGRGETQKWFKNRIT